MNNNLKELIHYRIEKAVELMRAAEILLKMVALGLRLTDLLCYVLYGFSTSYY